MNAGELQRSLVAHLRSIGRPSLHGPGTIAVGELTLGPAGAQRADVYALAVSYNMASTIFEVKVTRGDFLADVARGKWRGYLEHANQVLFATPAGLVKLDEIPAEAGLIEYRGEEAGWRTRKRGQHQAIGWDKVPLLQLLWRMNVFHTDETQRVRRIAWMADKDIREQARSVGRMIGRLLYEGAPDMERLLDAQRRIDELVGSQSPSPGQAIHNLDMFLTKTIPGIRRLGVAQQMVETANQLVNNRYHSPLSLAEELKRLAADLEAGAQ